MSGSQPTTSCIALSALLFLFPPAQSQDKASEIDTFVKACHQHRFFNGSVLVAERGKVLYKQGHGLANMVRRLLSHWGDIPFGGGCDHEHANLLSY